MREDSLKNEGTLKSKKHTKEEINARIETGIETVRNNPGVKKVEYAVKTAMQHRYRIKLIIRLIIFFSFLYLYLFLKEVIYGNLTHRFFIGWADFKIEPIHVLWAIFMLMMIRHLIPREIFTMAMRKSEAKYYQEVEGYEEIKLLRFVQLMNYKAWLVLLVWLCFNAIFGLLYVLKIIDVADLLMLTVFYFLCDYICILFFCPFQTFIMKNKCCVNCRIYEWGHFMMFTPMLFIKNFFSWSLFFTSLIVLIRWELIYAKHPERFWFGSNLNLQCLHCKDKTCNEKRKILELYRKFMKRAEIHFLRNSS